MIVLLLAADLFETYVIALVASIFLGNFIFPAAKEAILLPLILGTVALLSSILAIFFVRIKKENQASDGTDIMGAFYKGLAAVAIISLVGFYPIVRELGKNFTENQNSLYICAVIGILIAAGIFLITKYFTSKKHRPVQSIIKASTNGHATNIITGLVVGKKSTIFPIILICLGIFLSFWLAGLYGISITVIAMLSLVGIIIAMNVYGPITDNAAAIAKMANIDEEMRKIIDSLDSVGNTVKAMAKSYAIISAGFVAILLFSSFAQEIINIGNKIQILLNDPKVLIGLFVGGLLPYLFSSITLEAVGKTAAKVVEEVRRQFREIKGLMEGENLPKYGVCVDIVTKAAIKQIILPALIPVIIPILIGFLLGPEALGGLLIGSLITGLFIAISMTSGGAAWDNAKKYIEEGNLGGEGSLAHQAAITGDAVGDLYKDAVGPAMNPLIKVLNIVALLIVGFLK